MADEQAKVYADGTPIQEYPKWVRTGEGDSLKETLVNTKEEEDEALGKAKVIEKPKGWDTAKK